MADKNTTANSTPPVTDRTWFYTDLQMLPPEQKQSPLFCAQTLFFVKRNSNVLVEPKKARTYRQNVLLNVDENIYKQMIDPPTPMGGGATAEYFAADFKALPIATHLRNIRKAKLDKIGQVNKPQVNEINKFSKSQRQKDKDKAIHKTVFRDLISMVAKDLGLPPLSKSQSAEEYISKLSGDPNSDAADDTSRIIEQVKLQIKDDKDYALYERYVYKGEIERAFELGILHFLINQNKWSVVSQLFNADIENFNRASGRWVIDDTTGRGMVRYMDPSRLHTSPFKLQDGEDILYWFYEEPMPFSDFVRELGTTLTNEQLKEVFEINKANGGAHFLNWDECSQQQRNNALVNVGMCSFLSQDSQSFSESFAENSTPTWESKPINWKPDLESDKVKQKMYNVWYSFYYIPPPGDYLTSNRMTDWVWQQRFIFKIQKETDMYRYGVDRRYAKSSLIVWKDDKPSCTDIEEAFLPKIYNTWHKFQNCLIQDTTAVVIDEDFVLGILNAVDESNPNEIGNQKYPTGSNGINAGLEAFRMMRQGGIALMKFRDKNGNPIPNMKPQDFFVNVDTKHIEKAEKYLQLILQQYELLKMALAQSDVTEGGVPKPRTAVAAIDASIEASNNAIWFVEFPVRQWLIMYSERVVQHIINLVKEKERYGYSERWDSFKEVVGLANALMVEGIAELAPEDIGLTVSLEDTQQLQEWIFQLANQMATQNQVAWDAVGLVIDVARFNWKYAYAILMLSVKDKAEENAAQASIAHQEEIEKLQMQLQISQNLLQTKTQGAVVEIQTQGAVDAQLQQQLNQIKHQSQSDLKQQNTQNRILETDSKLNKEAEIKQQAPLI